MTTTTGTTTEPPPRRSLRTLLRRTSVRTRIALSVAVVSAFALGAAGLLVHTLESQRVQRIVTENTAQEIAELVRLQQQGVDPVTGRAFTSSQALLSTYLVRNVPDDDELLVGWWAGRPQERTRHAYGARLVADPALAPAVADLLPRGGTADLEQDGIGDYSVTVQPVSTASGRDAGEDPDALVIVNFLSDEEDELRSTMRTYAAVSVLLLVLIAVAAWLQAGRLLRPLRSLHASAEEIGATDLSRRLPVVGDDDIARLTSTFNDMLARLEHGFGSQRQFLDDAGHELRTPLTVLRGHLEVVDPHDADDVAQTSELLLDELDRMSRLVDELILLAKSDRPDFARLRPTPVAALLEQVHRKATGLAGRDWRLGPLPPATTEAPADEQRLTQALLQLCDNAVKHTGPGDAVTLSGEVVGDRLLLAVADTGPGVDLADRTRIFDRFGRAVVPEGDEGFGLGLSIVRAITEAHHGTARVEDAPGGGARFVLDLPLEGTTSWPVS
ncbi:sensor histidine kinase [Nocardioides aurantiacus]|uniref:histidine kinase n=1 Tax=Nocardioides aurantiacus TaxID=86796 RepID=A0A3N2CSY7_9ACTN|nr:HAMP domain-containing sensor histidine kinase [Nocardioides aurantiacus]ROR90354.1 signal transduction histidine kinase [Nocardioides aurantiacus]